MNLIALKKLRYPRGPDGKEYDIGDPFTVFSERDAKALTLVRAAKEAPAKDIKAKTARVESSPQSSLALSEKQMRPEDAGEGEALQPTRRRYLRRDMKAED